MRFGYAVLLAGAALTLVPSTSLAQKKQRDVITAEEMSNAPRDQNLFQAIRRLRPHFLEGPRGVRSMGNSQMGPIVVVVDGAQQSGLDALQSIMAVDVREVRYLEPSKSQDQYGIRANGGAIVVKMLNGKR